MKSERQRTTIDIPFGLVQKMRQALEQKIAPSRNALLIQALETYLVQWEQQKIDEAISEMANDPAYQALQDTMVLEYETAGWEALKLN